VFLIREIKQKGGNKKREPRKTKKENPNATMRREHGNSHNNYTVLGKREKQGRQKTRRDKAYFIFFFSFTLKLQRDTP